MNEVFTIGDFCFRLICPDALSAPENFTKFLGGERPEYTYTIELTSDFPEPQGRLLAHRPDLLVMENRYGEMRYIGVKGVPQPYACYMEMGRDFATVYLDPGRICSMNIDPMFTSLFALERRQLDRNAMVLHCAFMVHEGKAILFSAPSETGKTTQAKLWEKYRRTRVVNGDRALLQRIGDVWYARGWPVCGSSEVCHKEDVPVKAIVMLSQAPEDRAERMHPMKAFTQVYSQITVNRWNKAANLQVMELLEQLIAEVPVYHLACTMEETAVIALENAMNA